MAKRDKQSRLLIPCDIWETVGFSEYTVQNFAFFITNNSRVAIADVNLGKKLGYEFIGSCIIDKKHRFIVSENVEACLGDGNTYYFSTSATQSLIYLMKTSSIDYQHVKNLLISIRSLFNGIDAYLQEDNDMPKKDA